MPYKNGSEISVGDLLYVGLSITGKVTEFKPHPRFAEMNPGYTARLAVTDRGSITVIDQQSVRVPGAER